MSLTFAIILFVFLAVTIGVVGTYLTRFADRIADVTGLGEALVGGILLGGVTSLSGITTSVTAAYTGHPALSFSNAAGGIAAQTVFLAIADIVYRRANLEHASASLASLMQGVLLIGMLGFVIVVMAAPAVTLFAVHPASLVLILVYVFGNRLISEARKNPMWQPESTSETVKDESDEEDGEQVNLPWLLARFVALAVVVGVAGYFVADTGIIIAQETGVSESFLGALFTAVATSLPELVVSVSAVRRGALTLAVSNIIGGNSFDTLFLAFSDVAYRDGSIYHLEGQQPLFILSLTLVLTSVLLLGLLVRQKYGVGKVGWESALMILLFVAGYAVLYFMQ